MTTINSARILVLSLVRRVCKRDICCFDFSISSFLYILASFFFSFLILFSELNFDQRLARDSLLEAETKRLVSPSPLQSRSYPPKRDEDDLIEPNK
jgi:hypothetical protein